MHALALASSGMRAYPPRALPNVLYITPVLKVAKLRGMSTPFGHGMQ
jgi:hypothetical protein